MITTATLTTWYSLFSSRLTTPMWLRSRTPSIEIKGGEFKKSKNIIIGCMYVHCTFYSVLPPLPTFLPFSSNMMLKFKDLRKYLKNGVLDIKKDEYMEYLKCKLKWYTFCLLPLGLLCLQRLTKRLWIKSLMTDRVHFLFSALLHLETTNQ